MNTIAELAQYLRAHDDFIVIGHTNPDGDAHGCVIALTLALQKLGKRVCAYLPGGYSRLFQDFACTVEIAQIEALPFAPQTAFAVDVSEITRMGDARPVFDRCPATCMLDHHESNFGFAAVNVVDPKAAAAGELAVALVEELGVPLTGEIAKWLYIAIVTDCGRFGFSSTRAETMEAAAKLLRGGINVDEITRKLYSTRSEGQTRLLARVIGDMRMDADRQICYALLTEKMYAECGATAGDNDGIVNYLLNIRGVKIAFIVEEKGENAKVSLRSKPPLDVGAKVAQPLGGGGHACAAGVSFSQTSLESALHRVLELARLAL